MILKYGSKGTAVVDLQKLLIKNGLRGRNNKTIAKDGDFGDNTEFAVIQFQKNKNLKVDGIVGRKTILKLIDA